MAIIINEWHPDTCRCIFHYYWDDSVTQDKIVLTFFAVQNACPVHEKLIGLNKGEPDWEQPDHSVDTENAARFAIVGDALDRNETRNIDHVAAVDPERLPFIRRNIERHNAKVISKYSKIFAPNNVKALSKAVWDSGKEENDRKNIALDTILQNGPNTLFNLKGSSRLLKDELSLDVSWIGDPPNRVLRLHINNTTLTTPQKNGIQNALNNRFSSGRVVLV